MIDQHAVDEPEVHHFGRSAEMEVIVLGEPRKSIGALEEFVADSGSPLGGERRNVRDFLQMKFFRVVSADNHRKSVFKPEGLGDFQVEAIGVELLDAVVNRVRVSSRRFVQDGGQRRAGIFDVKVEFAGEKSFVDKQRAAEVGLSNNGNAGARFNVLSE